MVEQARLEQTPAGLAPAGDGWFAASIRELPWAQNEAMGAACLFEAEGGTFPQVGYTLAVLGPGQPNGMYHRENQQEDFLVLAGECVLLIEGEERQLQAWDFVHCPAGTEHVFIGAGEGPCVIFMAGARCEQRTAVYPRSELALRHGAGAELETSSASEAYAGLPGWEPGPPGSWAGLPWG
jgi:uncharacterized cupin superfamily protein